MLLLGSETKAFDLDLLLIGIYKLFGLPVNRVAFHINGLGRFGRANIFTTAATHTNGRVQIRDGQIALVGHHRNRLRGTMLGAGSTERFVGEHHAIRLDERDITHLSGMLLVHRQFFERPIGTNLRTQGTVVIAEPVAEIHNRLHHAFDTVFQERGFQYFGRTLRHT